MAGFDDPAFYGDRWAGFYDEHHARMEPSAEVEFLAGLAGDGRVLELGLTAPAGVSPAGPRRRRRRWR